MSVLEILTRGGWMMIPIALSSVAVIGLGIERWLVLRREKAGLARFVREWAAAPRGTDLSRFRSACKFGPRSVQGMANIIDQNPTDAAQILERVEEAARKAMFRLEVGLGTVATLAAATPLMGFLGTVTGMIRAFMQIQNLGGNVNANVLAGGIWEALVTTAAGLAVGILALIFHNYLVGVVRDIARSIEECATVAVRLISGGAIEN